jgi:hypothetical protein
MNEQKPDFSNKAYLFPHINKEGKRFGYIALALTALYIVLTHVVGCYFHQALIARIMGFFGIPFLLLSYGVFLFFRDPERYPPEDEKAILTDACKIFSIKNKDVYMVDGEVFNIKITYPYDLKVANTLLKGKDTDA